MNQKQTQSVHGLNGFFDEENFINLRKRAETNANRHDITSDPKGPLTVSFYCDTQGKIVIANYFKEDKQAVKKDINSVGKIGKTIIAVDILTLCAEFGDTYEQIQERLNVINSVCDPVSALINELSPRESRWSRKKMSKTVATIG